MKKANWIYLVLALIHWAPAHSSEVIQIQNGDFKLEYQTLPPANSLGQAEKSCAKLNTSSEDETSPAATERVWHLPNHQEFLSILILQHLPFSILFLSPDSGQRIFVGWVDFRTSGSLSVLQSDSKVFAVRESGETNIIATTELVDFIAKNKSLIVRKASSSAFNFEKALNNFRSLGPIVVCVR